MNPPLARSSFKVLQCLKGCSLCKSRRTIIIKNAHLYHGVKSKVKINNLEKTCIKDRNNHDISNGLEQLYPAVSPENQSDIHSTLNISTDIDDHRPELKMQSNFVFIATCLNTKTRIPDLFDFYDDLNQKNMIYPSNLSVEAMARRIYYSRSLEKKKILQLFRDKYFPELPFIKCLDRITLLRMMRYLPEEDRKLVEERDIGRNDPEYGIADRIGRNLSLLVRNNQYHRAKNLYLTLAQPLHSISSPILCKSIMEYHVKFGSPEECIRLIGLFQENLVEMDFTPIFNLLITDSIQKNDFVRGVSYFKHLLQINQVPNTKTVVSMVELAALSSNNSGKVLEFIGDFVSMIPKDLMNERLMAQVIRTWAGCLSRENGIHLKPKNTIFSRDSHMEIKNFGAVATKDIHLPSSSKTQRPSYHHSAPDSNIRLEHLLELCSLIIKPKYPHLLKSPVVLKPIIEFAESCHDGWKYANDVFNEFILGNPINTSLCDRPMIASCQADTLPWDADFMAWLAQRLFLHGDKHSSYLIWEKILLYRKSYWLATRQYETLDSRALSSYPILKNHSPSSNTCKISAPAVESRRDYLLEHFSAEPWISATDWRRLKNLFNGDERVGEPQTHQAS